MQNFLLSDASFISIKFDTNISKKLIIVWLLTLFTLKQAQAQTDSVNHPKINTNQELFLSKFDAYQSEKNISGLIAIAEQHHFPTAQKALQWQKELELNDRQKIMIGLIDKELQRKVNEMNNFLITNERTLDSLFKYKKINNGTLIFYTNRYGLYQGELRNALLQACVKTEAILTATQIKKYDRLLHN